jgi:hypothetical protein
MITPVPKVTLREEGHAATRDAVTTLIAGWRAAGTEFVVVDERGRHTEELRAGRLDLTRSPAMLNASWISAVLRRTGYVLLDASNVSRQARPVVIGGALAAVQLLRTQGNGPEWILVEDAQDALRQPGIPPHALHLTDGGYCLAVRGGAPLPAAMTIGASLDLRISQPDLELSFFAPVRTGITSRDPAPVASHRADHPGGVAGDPSVGLARPGSTALSSSTTSRSQRRGRGRPGSPVGPGT